MFGILRRIRSVYLALHQGTDSAPTQFSSSTGDDDTILRLSSSYPVCDVPGHHPDLRPHNHDDSTFTKFARAVPHDRDDTPFVPSFFTSSRDMPSLSAHTPLRVDESFADAPSRDKTTSVSVSLQSTDQTNTEGCRISATSPNRDNPRLTHGSIGTTHDATPELSASSPLSMPKVSTSPPDAAAVEYTPFSYNPSLDVPLSHSIQVLDGMPPPGPPCTPDSPMTGTDDISSSPESHPLMLAPDAPDASCPWISSAPDLGAAAEGEGSAMPTLRKEMDPLCLTSAVREVIANPDSPPQFTSPSPPPIVDVAAGGLSHGSLYAESTAHHSTRPSHGQNDDV